MTRIRIPALAAIALAASACAISQQQEVQMGAQYATQIDTQLPIVRDPQVVSYINELGASLSRVADQRGLAWRFAVVDSKEVNAFAVPGGWVYVNRGLITRAATMDELAGVLGHEIAHITLRHTVQQMQQSQKVGGGLMALCTLTKVCESGAGQAAINVGGTALFARFSRQDEAQADNEGVLTLVKARIDPQGMPKMFRILLAERQTNPSAVDAFFSTHPLAEDRITATTRQIGLIPPERLRNVIVDTEAFRSLKRRLAQLPPSPPPRVVAK
jgi:predicted Zn-dependent protease